MKNLKEKYGKVISVILCAVVIILMIADVWATSKKVGTFQVGALPVFIGSIILSVCLMVGVITDNKKMVKGNLLAFFAMMAFIGFMYIFLTPMNQKSGTLFDAVNFTKNGWAYSLHALFTIISNFLMFIGLFVFIASHYFESSIPGTLTSCILRTVAIIAFVNIAWTITAHFLNLYSKNSNAVFELYNIAKDLSFGFSAVLIGTLKVND